MSNLNVSAYKNYFRGLAISHHLIQHNPDSDNGQGEPGTKRFCTWSADQVATGLRTAIGELVMLLDLFEINTNAENVTDIKGNYTGAFNIIKTATIGDYESENEAYETCGQIVEDILRKIWADHYGDNKSRCNTPLATFNYSNLNIIPIGPLWTGYYGWRVEFTFKPKQTIDVLSPLPEGVFI